MTLYYNQQGRLVRGVGAQTGGITPGTFSDDMFTASGSHATMSNGASNDYFLAIFAGAPLVVGQSYDALLNFGPFVLEQGVNTTVTVLGVSPAGVVVQAITPGVGSVVWQFETFLIGSTDTANGEVICGFDTIGGDVTCFAKGTLIATP